MLGSFLEVREWRCVTTRPRGVRGSHLTSLGRPVRMRNDLGLMIGRHQTATRVIAKSNYSALAVKVLGTHRHRDVRLTTARATKTSDLVGLRLAALVSRCAELALWSFRRRERIVERQHARQLNLLDLE